MARRNRPVRSAAAPAADRPNDAPPAKQLQETDAPRPLGSRDALFLLALVVVVFFVYLPAWDGGPLWDDDMHITRPELRSLEGLGRIWYDVGATLQYYPLLHSAFWVQQKLWGETTLGYHLVTIALHAAAAVLAALVLRRLAVPGAYLAAAIFALHPVHVESVAWITELKNTLSTVFYLGAALAYLRFDRTRGARPYALAVTLFVLGLLSKTVVGTFPAAMLVVFWWKRGRLSWRSDVLPLVPFFLLGALGGTVTAWWEWELNACQGGPFDFTFIERTLIASRAVWFQLSKLFWPVNLIFIYPRWQIDASVWWQYLFPLGLLALVVVCWALRGRSRAPLAALLFFMGTLFPVLGFFNLYTFRYSFVANHYQYLASLGIIALVAAAITTVIARMPPARRPIGYALCLVLVAALAGMSWSEAHTYADVETLYRTTIARHPGCWMAYNNLGKTLAGRGRSDEAMQLIGRSLELNPENVSARNNLGVVLVGRGQTEKAVAEFSRVLDAQPENAPALVNLGNIYMSRGQLDQAIDTLEKAIAIDPRNNLAHVNLANALAERGQKDRAIDHYRRAVRLDPEHAGTRYNLGVVLAQLDRRDEALLELRRALELATAQRNRALTTATRRQLRLLDTP